MPDEAFDPKAHMRTIKVRGRGEQPYLDVKWRVIWLRSEHADASIVTEQIEASDKHARFKATVSYERDGRVVIVTGHGSETATDFGDYYEKAETKAIGRACVLAGYGTEMAADLDDDQPAETTAPVAAAEPPTELQIRRLWALADEHYPQLTKAGREERVHAAIVKAIPEACDPDGQLSLKRLTRAQMSKVIGDLEAAINRAKRTG